MINYEFWRRVLAKRTELPMWVHVASTCLLSIVAYFVIDHAITANREYEQLQQVELERNRNYIERMETEKLLLLNAITDVTSPQIIADEELIIQWVNSGAVKLLGKPRSKLIHFNLNDFIPTDLSKELQAIAETYQFKNDNERVSIHGVIIQDGKELPVIVTFISVEKSWTLENDGYFIFTILPSDEQVSLLTF